MSELDQSWQNLKHVYERVRWSRMRWAERMGGGFLRPTDAARSLNVKPGTYRTWEHPKDQGGREPSRSEIVHMAAKFGVSWVWLQTGMGSPYQDPEMEAQINAFQQKASLIADKRERELAVQAALNVLDTFSRKAS